MAPSAQPAVRVASASHAASPVAAPTAAAAAAPPVAAAAVQPAVPQTQATQPPQRETHTQGTQGRVRMLPKTFTKPATQSPLKKQGRAPSQAKPASQAKPRWVSCATVSSLSRLMREPHHACTLLPVLATMNEPQPCVYAKPIFLSVDAGARRLPSLQRPRRQPPRQLPRPASRQPRAGRQAPPGHRSAPLTPVAQTLGWSLSRTPQASATSGTAQGTASH